MLSVPLEGVRGQNDCNLYAASGYLCVDDFLCNATGYIITDGGGLIDLKVWQPGKLCRRQVNTQFAD